MDPVATAEFVRRRFQVAKLTELEERANGLIDKDEMWRTLEYLDTVDRTSGTEGEFAAVHWLARKLAEYGVQYKIHEFEGYLSFPIRASLRVVGPMAKELRAKTRAFGACTPPGGLAGDVIFVDSQVKGIGFQESDNQFEGVDVKGKIVLSPRGGPDGVYDAMQAGAIAHIHYWPSQEDTIHEMISTTVWGTPTPEAAERIPTIPSISVNNESGLYLRKRCEEAATRGERVTVKLTAQTETRWCKQLLPEAIITGTEEPDKFFLVASHIDAWYVGITDNGTGNAACLELARVLEQLRREGQLKRSVRITWWTGHSTGRYAGSTWYCDNHWAELNKDCIGYVDIDSPGTKNATVYDEICAMADNYHIAQEIIGAITGQEIGRERPLRAGDYSFLGPGVPAMYMLLGSVPKEQRYSVGGCGLNWWWHTEYDTLDTADAAVLEQDTKIYLATILRIVNSAVLPYQFAPVAEELLGALRDYQGAVGDHFDLEGVATRLTELRQTAANLDGLVATAQVDTAVAAAVNKAIMRAQRALIPINYTQIGEFDHDPAVYQPILPSLAEARKLTGLKPTSDMYKFLQTKLVRSRNKVNHALDRAAEELNQAVALLGAVGKG
jgi:N-acetylated-alpha-linked acidic dipeptidase